MDMEMDLDQPPISAHALHSMEVLRDALKRELECELRGLILAAHMHGFELSIQSNDGRMIGAVRDAQQT